METFKSLAHKLGVTTNGVRLHLRKLQAKDPKISNHIKYTTKLKKYNFDSYLSNLLIKSFNNNSKAEKTATKVEIQRFTDQMKALVKNNKTLKHSNNYLEKSNTHLEKLLDHQQQLQLASKHERDNFKHENDLLKSQVKHLKLLNGPKNSTKANPNDHSTNDTKSVKHGIIGRLFHKYF